jgi:hypothetical protein
MINKNIHCLTHEHSVQIYWVCVYIYIYIYMYFNILILEDYNPILTIRSLRRRHIDICDKFLVQLYNLNVTFYVNLYTVF